MADIEETIFKLSIDGSAYVEGANKLSDSTKKLSAEQEHNNDIIQKLKVANIQLAEETKALTTQYNKAAKDLRELVALQEKAPVPIAKYAIAIKAAEESQRKLSAAIVENKDLLKQSSVAIKEAEKASGGFASGLKNVYGGLSRVANLIPGLGIAGLVAIISGPVISAFKNWFDSINSVNNAAAQQKKLLDEIFANAGQSSGADIAHLEVLRSVLTDLNKPLNERLLAVREYNKLADDGNKIDETQINNINLINSAIGRQIEQIGKLSLAKAFENKLGEQAAKVVELELQLKSKKPVSEGLTTAGFDPNNPLQALERQLALEKEVRAENPKLVKDIEDAKKAFQDLLNFSRDFIDFADVVKPPKKGKGKVERLGKEALNIYQAELDKLRLEISKLEAKGFTTEESITAAIDADFKKRKDAFIKAQQKGQLTPDQFKDLVENLKKLRKLLLTESIKTFNQQRAALLEKIDSELSAIETEAALKRVANIQDSFERQRQAIISESDKLIKARQIATQKQIAEIQKSNILTPGEIKNAVEKASAAMDEFILQVNIATNQKLQQLAFDTFEKVSEDLQQSLKNKQFDVSALSLLDIQKQTELLQQGKISYEQYQKELTRIAKDESDKRLQLEIANLRIEINRRQSELRDNRALSDDQQERLLKEIREREAQVNALEKTSELDQGKGSKTDAAFKARIDKFVTYTQAIGNLAQNVISFWQQANAAESAALERSIALQQRRVDAAQRIAERGNAQYLKQEQDRLTDLNTQRENAARKQLGINAALQGSEILVSLISGIAQGAKLGGALGAITSVAAIVAAIAGAFAIAQSLKPPTPTFFVGTKDTGRGGALDSKGGFAATIHPHEAITSAEKNKAYHPVIEAIHDGTIPAETLNKFVTTYHKIKSVPLPNYERIKDAAELHIGSDGRMSLLLSEQNKKMDENTLIQRQVLRALKSMGVNVNMDKNGIAVSVMEAVEQIKINSRA